MTECRHSHRVRKSSGNLSPSHATTTTSCSGLKLRLSACEISFCALSNSQHTVNEVKNKPQTSWTLSRLVIVLSSGWGKVSRYLGTHFSPESDIVARDISRPPHRFCLYRYLHISSPSSLLVTVHLRHVS